MGQGMDRIAATITGQYVSGYTRKFTRKDGTSGESGCAYILREGRNSPDKIDLPVEVLDSLTAGQLYAFDCLLKAKSFPGTQGMVTVLEVWVYSAAPAVHLSAAA